MKHRSHARFALEGLEGVAVLMGVLLTWPVSKRWLKNWGSTDDERERTWPGDHLVSRLFATFTRAITIGVPPAAGWEWIVQFGLDRAGFYSYELLERVIGIPVVNVESILPEMQSLKVGDEIRLHPKAPGIPIGEIRPGEFICFGVRPDSSDAATCPNPNRSWSLYIEPNGQDSCRLLLRTCLEPLRDDSWLKRSAAALEESIDFVMEQRMLRSIKRLAERSRQ